MAEPESLYGIWNNTRNRWARLTPPVNLCRKYGRNSYPTEPLFATHQEIEEWFFQLHLALDPDYDYSIRLSEEDQRRRQLHAEKYL